MIVSEYPVILTCPQPELIEFPNRVSDEEYLSRKSSSGVRTAVAGRHARTATGLAGGASDRGNLFC